MVEDLLHLFLQRVPLQLQLSPQVFLHLFVGEVKGEFVVLLWSLPRLDFYQRFQLGRLSLRVLRYLVLSELAKQNRRDNFEFVRAEVKALLIKPLVQENALQRSPQFFKGFLLLRDFFLHGGNDYGLFDLLGLSDQLLVLLLLVLLEFLVRRESLERLERSILHQTRRTIVEEVFRELVRQGKEILLLEGLRLLEREVVCLEREKGTVFITKFVDGFLG